MKVKIKAFGSEAWREGRKKEGIERKASPLLTGTRGLYSVIAPPFYQQQTLTAHKVGAYVLKRHNLIFISGLNKAIMSSPFQLGQI